MLVETTQIIPITKLQKELTQTVRKISLDKEPVYIVKNNIMEAVIIPFEHFEFLSKLEEIYEHTEIANMIQIRTKNYDASKAIDWTSIKKE